MKREEIEKIERLINIDEPKNDFQVPEAAVGQAKNAGQKDTAVIETNYWLINEKLKKNAFYSMLESLQDENTGMFKYDYILGIDFGHGETVACILKCKNEGGTTKLEPNEFKITEKDNVIHTKIGFTRAGEIVIGKEAVNYETFFQNFKVSPLEWGVTGIKKNNCSLKYNELIAKYFQQLFINVLEHANKNVTDAMKNGKLLVCVGCPSSDEWINKEAMNEYAELVRKAMADAISVHDKPAAPQGSDNGGSDSSASGFADKNDVSIPMPAVVPESTAALMSLMLKSDNIKQKSTAKINIDKGLIVFDFGSSTIDLTFLIPGRCMITRSRKIGGHDIDKLIYKTALRKLGIEKDDISEAEQERILAEIREKKEAVYHKSGSPEVNLLKILNKEVNIDKDFMKEVWETEINKTDGKFLDCCKTFIKNCRTDIESIADKCEGVKVVLSGGTSNVTELQCIVEDVFGKENVVELNNPSLCVAEGLCLMKKIELKGISHLKKYKNRADWRVDSFCGKVPKIAASFFTHIVAKEAKAVMEQFAAEHRSVTLNELTAEIENRVRKNPDVIQIGSTGTAAKAVSLGTREFSEEMTKKANDISKEIYGEEEFAFEFSLPDDIKTPSDNTNSWEQTVDFIIMKTIIPLLFQPAVLVAAIFASVLSTFFNLKDKTITDFQALLLKAGKKRQTKIMWPVLAVSSKVIDTKLLNAVVVNELKESLKCSNAFIGLRDYFQIVAEALLGKVMLYVFDNKPDSK